MNLAVRAAASGPADLIAIAGERAVCDPRGVLYFPELSLLAVSDLHLEKGSSLARRGALIPPYDTAATLLRLPASRAMAFISTVPAWISGTSSSNSRRRKFLWVRLT